MSASEAMLYKSTCSSVIRQRYYHTLSHWMRVLEQLVKEWLLSTVYAFHSYRTQAFKWIDHQTVLHLLYPCAFCHQSEALKNSQPTSESVYVNQPLSGLLPATSACFLVLGQKCRTTFEIVEQLSMLSTMPNTYNLRGAQFTIYKVSSYLWSTGFLLLNKTTTTNTNLSSNSFLCCLQHLTPMIYEVSNLQSTRFHPTYDLQGFCRWTKPWPRIPICPRTNDSYMFIIKRI